jgi:hypothetical protein
VIWESLKSGIVLTPSENPGIISEGFQKSWRLKAGIVLSSSENQGNISQTLKRLDNYRLLQEILPRFSVRIGEKSDSRMTLMTDRDSSQ